MEYLQQQSEEEVVQYAEMLRLIAHPIRLQIIEKMIQKGSISVKEIDDMLDVPHPTISQHMTKLKKYHIIKSTRKRLEVSYQVADIRVEEVVKLMRT